MTYERLSDRLASAAQRAFVGRRRELSLLDRWADSDGAPAVVFLHGSPGVGKSALVRAFAAARRPGDVVVVDGQDVEPTPLSFLSALGAASGARADLGAIGEALAGGTRCLVVDGVHRLALLDSWLRTELLPALPAPLTTVLVDRRRPNAAWLTAPGWQSLVAELPLGPLDEVDAAAMLRGLGSRDDPTVLRFARGHPLALRLAASIPGGLDDASGTPASIEHLVDRFLDGLDAVDVRLLQAATTLRRVTETDIAALVDGDGHDDVWRRLRDLPFAELRVDGLELHEIVRDAVQLSLARRDPAQHRALRARAIATVRARVAAEPISWSATADLLYLVPDRSVRDGFFPPDGHSMPVDDTAPTDRDAVVALVERCDGPDAAATTIAWFDAHPRSLRVARASDGTPVAVQSVVERAGADPWLLRQDPITLLWATHLDRNPLPAGANALFVRRSIADGTEAHSPAMASLFVDVKRTYMELRPALQRVYVGTAADDRTMLHRLGFRDLGTADVHGSVHRAMVLDMGPGSVDGWLAGLLDADLAVATDDHDGGESPIGALTARERDVLRLVASGATNKDVSAALGISVKTVGRHLENLYAKLGVTSRAAAARIATAEGLVR